MTVADRLREEGVKEAGKKAAKNLLVMGDSIAKIAMVTGLTEKEIEEIKEELGKTSDGKDITLYRCFYTELKFNSSGMTTTVILANMIFEGVHFNTEEEIVFNELSCRYTHLDEWAWINGIAITPPGDSGLGISYQYPASISVDIDDDYTIEVYPITQMPSYCLVQKQASIVQRIYVRIISKNHITFEKHQHKLHHMRNFISLGVGEPVEVIDVMGKTEANKETYDGQVSYPKVKIYFCIKKASDDYKPIPPQRMLFNLRDIQKDFDVIIQKWFAREETLQPVFDLYFGTIYNSGMYLEQRFLSLIQALESYHRRTRINNEMDEEDHKKRVDEVIASVDDKYKKWIKGRLAYSNEPTLRSRLTELIEECRMIINLPSSRRKKSFINKVCDTRNYLTHYDVSLCRRTADETELFEIGYKLKIIIQYNLLLELDFEHEVAYQLLEEKYKRLNI